MVALFHLQFSDSKVTQSLFVRNSDIFVDFFFVLSGLVIYHAYENRISTIQELKIFLHKRIRRIYPLHLFVLSLWIVAEVFKFQTSNIINYSSTAFTINNSSTLISQLLLLNSYGIDNTLAWNYPSWSISAEFFAYFIFSLFILLISKRLRLILALLIAFLSLLILFNNTASIVSYTYNLGFIRCLYGFFIGCLVLDTRKFINYIPHKNISSALEVFIIIILVLQVNFLDTINSYVSPLLFGVFVFIYSYDNGCVSKFLQSHVFQLFGKVSYSIYMIHALIAIFFNIISRNCSINNDYLILPYLLTVILFANFVHLKFERNYFGIVKR